MLLLQDVLLTSFKIRTQLHHRMQSFRVESSSLLPWASVHHPLPSRVHVSAHARTPSTAVSHEALGMCTFGLHRPHTGKMFLLLVDVDSKWIEAHPKSSTTAKAMIEQLRSIVAHFGIPETLVPGNDPQFAAKEFRLICSSISRKSSANLEKMTEGTLADRVLRLLRFSYQSNPYPSLIS